MPRDTAGTVSEFLDLVETEDILLHGFQACDDLHVNPWCCRAGPGRVGQGHAECDQQEGSGHRAARCFACHAFISAISLSWAATIARASFSIAGSLP
jgi:DNA-directed RNA polymerase subunit N (RpoN/RPB10)